MNATGVSARAVAGDATVHPVRGQVVVLENPGLTEWWCDEDEADGPLYALPTYTALLELRDLLARRGQAEEYWR